MSRKPHCVTSVIKSNRTGDQSEWITCILCTPGQIYIYIYISVDISTDSQLMYRTIYQLTLNRYVGRHIHRHLADMSTEICRPIYQPRYQPSVGRHIVQLSADMLTIDCRWNIGRLSVDISTDSRPMYGTIYRPTLDQYVGRHIYWHSADILTEIFRSTYQPIYRSIVARHSTDMSVDMLTGSGCWPTSRSRGYQHFADTSLILSYWWVYPVLQT